MVDLTGSRGTVRAVTIEDEAAMDWDVVVDVVVAGGGSAGFAAAAAARAEGSSVVLLEKAAYIGGTSAKSSGAVYWVPNNSYMRAAGIEDPRDDAIRYMARLANPRNYDPDHPTLGLPADRHGMIETYYDEGPRVIDRLAESGAIDPCPIAVPDYRSGFPENKAPRGRALRPKDASLQDGGTALMDLMLANATEAGVDVRTDHRVIGLLRDTHGSVLGVQVQARRGLLLVRAFQGVIFATGGFVQDEELSNEFLRGPIFGGCSAESSTGDFVRIAMDAGADLANMNNAWWSELVLDRVLMTRSTSRDMTFNYGDSMFFVNRFGRRVVNEKAPYNDRGQVHHYWDATTAEFPNLLLFMVFDEDVAQMDAAVYNRDPVPPPGESASHVISAETLEELGAKIDARLTELQRYTGRVRLDPSFDENLTSTFTRFNEMACKGVDEDFGRGNAPIDHFFHTPDRKAGLPNATMHPLRETGPYHAVILAPGALDTKGGPRTDVRARVLDVKGDPIPGLFGAGNCVASAAGEGYWGAGGTIGPALVFGYLAGETAASQPRRTARLDST